MTENISDVNYKNSWNSYFAWQTKNANNYYWILTQTRFLSVRIFSGWNPSDLIFCINDWVEG
jgi:hypothetical protein